MKVLRKFGILMLVCSVFALTAASAAAKTSEEYSQEIEEKQAALDEANALIEELQLSVDEKTKEAAEVKAQIAEKDLEIAELEEKIADNSQILNELDEDIANLNEQCIEMEHDMVQAEADRDERLAALYMHTTSDDLQCLFASSSIIDFLNRLDAIKLVYDYDSQYILDVQSLRSRYTEAQSKIIEKRSVYTEREDELQEDVSALADLKDELSEQQTLLDAMIAAINAHIDEEEANAASLNDTITSLTELYEVTKAEEEEAARIAEEARKRAEELARQAAEEAAKASSESSDNGGNGNSTAVTYNASTSTSHKGCYVSQEGGIFAWPTPGVNYISSDYGYRIHPILGYEKFHSGIDISGVDCGGKEIVAVSDGVVIYAGWQSGYGNTVIINHGGGITTLYGHARELNCSVGDEVVRGQCIAYIGTTGMSTGNHLHFEVRLDGVATDPWPFIS